MMATWILFNIIQIILEIEKINKKKLTQVKLEEIHSKTLNLFYL